MDDSGAMRRCERAGDLPRVDEQPIDRQPVRADRVIQRRPVDVLHHDEVDAIRRVDIVDGDDVWMVQARRRLRFLEEAAPVLAGLEALSQHFDGHLALQADIDGLVDDTHATVTDFAADGVTRRSRQRGQHGGSSWWTIPLPPHELA